MYFLTLYLINNLKYLVTVINYTPSMSPEVISSLSGEAALWKLW